MRAGVIEQIGGPDVLRLEEAEHPEPSEGDLLVRVRARADRRREAYARGRLPVDVASSR
jgi:NADPH:quinone reductase-like Zn-dependent oxidoreductase